MVRQTGLATSLGPLKLENKIFIGAGAIKTLEDVTLASEIEDLSLILIGSYTRELREGNPGEVYYYDGQNGVSLNSIGLRNGGKEYLEKHLEEMVYIANTNGKIMGLSVSGETSSENAELIRLGMDMGVEYFEVNTACGNVISQENNRSKNIACYNMTAMERTFEAIANIRFDPKRHYKTFKVGKYLNFSDIDQLAIMNNTYDAFDGVVTTNTEKSIILNNEGKPVIEPDNGFGGLGGKPLKPGGLGQTMKWKEVMREKDVISVGGIFTGDDVMDYENCYATAMQYVTAYLKHGNPDREAQGVISARYYDLYMEKIKNSIHV